MKRHYLLCLCTVTLLLLGGLPAFGMECQTPPFINEAQDPNILIIFDNSGSMNIIIYLDSYNPSVDHTMGRLPTETEDEIVWAPLNTLCIDDINYVYRQSTDDPNKGLIAGRTTLMYMKAGVGIVDPCAAASAFYYQQGDANGYFYFDRGEDARKFINVEDYDPFNPNHIKVFLPYAVQSEDPITYKTRYTSDYLNWIFYDSTPDDRAALEQQHKDPNQRALLLRIHVAKDVTHKLIDSIEGVRFGLMKFRLLDGGKVIAPLGSTKEEIHSQIDTLWGDTMTPLAESLEDAWLYFKGELDQEGGGDDGSDPDGIPDFPSPIEHWCQKNFVIIMTDGFPAKDGDDGDKDGIPDDLEFLREDYDGDSGGGSEMDRYPANGSDYLDDIAYYIYGDDCSDLPEKQNIYTFTIGFNIYNQLLKDTAFNGNGLAGRQDEWADPASRHYHRHFYTAYNYTELEAALDATLNEIINKVASGTAVAVQSTSTEAKKRLLRAKFVTDGWKGYLEAFELPYTAGESPVWEAGEQLKDRGEAGRYIFTALDDTAGADVAMRRKVLFTAANSTTEDADTQKLADLLGALDDAEAKKIIRYIRGASVDGYRQRNGWKLGDITYSSPVISGNMAYVGANDGMLHAFDINTGEEKWAFIPNNLLPKLKDLALLDYCHEYFVDLSPRVAEIFVGGVHKRVIVGGERGGGNSFFALDITDPSADAVQPLWEFSDRFLGQSWTIPAIARCWLDGAVRWVAFVGSSFGNKDTKGYLFAVDVVTGEKMGTPLCLADAPDNHLPSLRAIDFDTDGFTDTVYVGSLTGKMFMVKIGPEANPKAWASTAKHLFTTSPGQPITIPTSLSLYQEAGETHIMAYFGTGKYYTAEDRADLSLQSFYAIKGNALKIGRGGLADQTDEFLCSPMQDKFGWYIDLLQGPGERVLSSGLVIAGYVFFTTFQPSDDPCDAGGIARLYCVGYENGCVPTEPAFDINGDEVVDENDKINGVVPRSIDLGYGVPSDIVFNPSEGSIVIQTSDTTIHQFKINLDNNKLTIHSWREVFD